MAHEQCIGIRSALKSTFPDSWLQKTAREVGFVQRERKIKATTFFWTLVLGFSAGAERSIAAFRRAYEKAAGVTVVPASFYDRFNAGLVEFLKTAVEKALDDFAAASSDVHERLQRFKDVMLVDSTILTLHDALQPVFRGAQTRAAAKLNAVLSVRGKGRSTIGLYSGNRPEQRTLSVGPWVAGRLLIFDKGYCCYTLFAKIHENAGYFLTRLKDHCNPTILKVHSAVRVNPALLQGRPLRIAVNDLRRETFDATVEVYFPRLLTNGKRRFTKGLYRLIGLYDTEKSKYHFYITNVPRELLAAEDAYNVYRVRWEIELIFKELKSGYGLGGITSCSEHVVKALIYSAVITLIVSKKLFRSVAPHLGSRAERATGSRWWRLFATHAYDLLFVVTRQPRENAATRELLQLLMHEMVDPHLRRKRLLSQDTRPAIKKRRARRRRLAPQT